MSRPSTPTASLQTKPYDTSPRSELLAIKKFRDAKNLPIKNNELFEHVGVSRSTGYRILKDKPRRSHNNPSCDETRGRRPALSDDQVDQIVAFLKTEGYEGRALPWANICDAASLEFPTKSGPPTPQTIQKHLNKRGWKKCVACRKFWVDSDIADLREAFAREEAALGDHGLDFSYWRRIRHSDKVHFKSGPEGKVSKTRRSNGRYCTPCIEYRQRPTENEDRQVCLSALEGVGRDR
ncbi:hypothetical protein GGR55DRAFT_70405 [Xylaria sp. FL0064]|nr:hypothetical protein GGR55DRAFT_70405 [Xylaria sp. FL0064]